MRGNLDRINVDLQRLRGGDHDRGEQRRSVMVALAQNNCGPQYRTAARAPGGFFDQLFGRDANEPSGDLANPMAQSGTVRTICVRTCDGFYFPISYATNASRFREDEKTCQRMCPAAEVMLFSYPTEGEDVAQATSINGQPYSALPNAFKYRQEFNAACSCKRPGQSWADALGKDEAVEPGDVVVTEERAKQIVAAAARKRARPRAAQPAAGQPLPPRRRRRRPPRRAAPRRAAAAETEPEQAHRRARSARRSFAPRRSSPQKSNASLFARS